jgi:TRAP transporter 4TM/12TM fusion protein
LVFESQATEYRGTQRYITWVIDGLFMLAIAGMLYTQLTKTTFFYTGNQDRIIHLGLATVLVVLGYMRRRRETPRLIEGVVVIVAMFLASSYFYSSTLAIIARAGFGSGTQLVGVGVMMVVIFRFTFLMFGWVFPILAFLGIFYAFTANHWPGPFHGPELHWERIMGRYARGMHGGLVIISTNYLWLLMFWGMLLAVTGVNISVMKAAGAVSRVMRAGPAMVALVSSAIAGGFTAQGAANTMITGPVTIPAMKRAGYTGEEAAAVEALASNAASITPPIMGAVAFLMVSYMGVSYITVMVMVLPAAGLWYLGVLSYLYAHGRRHRHRIATGVDLSMFDDASKWVVTKSALMGIIPVGVLIYLLNQGFTLRQVTIWAFVALVASYAVLRVERRLSVLLPGIRQAAIMASAITLTLATLEIFDISLVMTALEVRLAEILYDMSAGNVLVAVALMIVGGVILGAALPPIAVFYVMVLTFLPVLAKFDVPRNTAIFVSFYMGSLSTIAPPVAQGILLASTIAGVSYWKASWRTVVMGLPLYFFPFLFVFSPEVILQSDDIGRTIMVLGIMSITLVYMEMAVAGWFVRDLTRMESIVLAMAPVVAFFGLYLKIDLLLWIAPAAPLVLGLETALRNISSSGSDGVLRQQKGNREGANPMSGYFADLEHADFPCPVCHWRFSSMDGLISHFASAIDGKGTTPTDHEKWAKKMGVFRKRTWFSSAIRPKLVDEVQDTLAAALHLRYQESPSS